MAHSERQTNRFRSRSQLVKKIFQTTLLLAENWGQFHQHSKSSFYACRPQKRQKDSLVKELFALLGSAYAKAKRKFVDEIDPRPLLNNQFKNGKKKKKSIVYRS